MSKPHPLQTVDDTRQFLALYDPELGKPLPERTYCEDCRIYAPDHPKGPFYNLLEKFDIFVLCHFFGWYVKVGLGTRHYRVGLGTRHPAF